MTGSTKAGSTKVRGALGGGLLLVLTALPAWADGKGDSGLGNTIITSPANLVDKLFEDLFSIAETGKPWVVRYAEARQRQINESEALVQLLRRRYPLLPHSDPEAAPADFLFFLVDFYRAGFESGPTREARAFLEARDPQWASKFERPGTHIPITVWRQARSALNDLRFYLEYIIRMGPMGTDVQAALSRFLWLIRPGAPVLHLSNSEQQASTADNGDVDATSRIYVGSAPNGTSDETAQGNGNAEPAYAPPNGLTFAPRLAVRFEFDAEKLGGVDDQAPDPDCDDAAKLSEDIRCAALAAAQQTLANALGMPSETQRSPQAVEADFQWGRIVFPRGF